MPATDLAFERHLRELRETWQAKTLAAASGRTAAVLLSVLAHNFDEVMPTLLRAVYPGFASITAPFLSSAGKVAKTGAIIADMVTRDGHIVKNAALYEDETRLRDDFRRLADKVALSDEDRTALFDAVRKWVVCDYRIDPTMDPKDPDAKRLVN